MELATELLNSIVDEQTARLQQEVRNAPDPQEPPPGCFFVGEGRFRKAHRFDAEELNLCCHWLQEVPAELERCTNLRRLYIGSNYIEKIEHLPASLEVLDMSPNHRISKIENIPPGVRVLGLSETAISKLENLPPNLEDLDVWESPVAALENLPDSLRKLNVSYTPITSLQGLPPRLRELDISGTQITSLEGLPDSLRKLKIKSLRFLPSEEDLPKGLRRLRARNTFPLKSALVVRIQFGARAAEHGFEEDVSDFSDTEMPNIFDIIQIIERERTKSKFRGTPRRPWKRG